MATAADKRDAAAREQAAQYLGMHFASASAWRDPERPVFVRGEGCYLWDDKGDRYLD